MCPILFIRSRCRVYQLPRSRRYTTDANRRSDNGKRNKENPIGRRPTISNEIRFSRFRSYYSQYPVLSKKKLLFVIALMANEPYASGSSFFRKNTRKLLAMPIVLLNQKARKRLNRKLFVQITRVLMIKIN